MNKIIIFIFGIILLTVAIGYFASFAFKQGNMPGYGNNNSGRQTANFEQRGVLVINNPGLKPDTWYLVYEQPGAPAINAQLKFNSESVCFINDNPGSCNPDNLKNGDDATVEGDLENGLLTVRRLFLSDEVSGFRDVLLYFYNPDTDKDETGNILCSRQGLAAVSRRIQFTNTPVQDSIKLLLEGKLSEGERKAGITTEFPLPGVELKSANLKNGILSLEFNDLQNKTSGGSCRAAILWYQIEATAKQFPEVKEVRFLPETLFQP